MISEDLDLDQGWSIGEKSFSFLIQEFRANAVRTVVEFGAGRSSVRLALEFPEAEICSIDHDKPHFEYTARLKERYAPRSNLHLHLRPLAWQMHAGGLYWSYDVGPFPRAIDAVIIDGPPGWTRRGREACLYQVIERVLVGGHIYLDDFSRPGEQQIVLNWKRALHQAFSIRQIEIDHSWCVLEKQGSVTRPSLNFGVAVDSWEQFLGSIREGLQGKTPRTAFQPERNPVPKQPR